MSKNNFCSLVERIVALENDGRAGESRFQAEVTPEWTQGRACFGGLQAAYVLRAMRLTLNNETPLRSLQTSFIAPIEVGSIEIQVRSLRQGSNVTQMHGEILQNGQVCCVVNGCFGKARESALELPARGFPDDVMEPDQLVDLPYIKGVTPEFLRQYQVRWGKGAFPFTAAATNTTGIWVKSLEQGMSSIEQLVLVSDVPPTPVLSKLKQPAPHSSLTWMLEILQDDFEARTDDWWFVETTLEHFNHGYGQQQYTIYAPDRTVVALGRQVTAVFG